MDLAHTSRRPKGWAANYVGIPFVDGGRGREGLDCWGLVHLVYAEVFGVALPGYGEISAHDVARVSHRIRADRTLPPWRAAEVAQPGDVLVMRGRPLHVGVMVDAIHLLHVETATASVIVPRTHPQIRWRVIGLHRHEALDREACA